MTNGTNWLLLRAEDHNLSNTAVGLVLTVLDWSWIYPLQNESFDVLTSLGFKSVQIGDKTGRVMTVSFLVGPSTLNDDIKFVVSCLDSKYVVYLKTPYGHSLLSALSEPDIEFLPASLAKISLTFTDLSYII
jgi:hypothetical protein